MDRPVIAFELAEESDTERICDHCRTYGPPLSDPTAELDATERKAIKLLASGMKVQAVARQLKLNEKTIRKALSGEENLYFRTAFQRLMLQADLGPDALITVMKDAMNATKQSFDKEGNQINEAPDHSSRLAAARMLQRAWGYEAPPQRASQDGVSAASITVVTNLGSASHSSLPGELIARAPIDVTPEKSEET